MENIEKEIKNLKLESIKDINDAKVKYLGKKGIITELSKKMKDLTIEEKKSFGKSLNELKIKLNEMLESAKIKIEEKQLNEKLQKEEIDVTLPGTTIEEGSPNILEKIVEEIEELLLKMGYDVVDGPEVEKDEYNFTLLNLPKDHPARDAQDSFYLKGTELLLRSQTSPVQIRTMLANEKPKPIKMICPGKTYRRDDDDATHSHQFTQIEGLVIDKDISLSDLKGTVTEIVKNLFGQDTEIRFRPSYYPFTEPSVEIDMSCFNCKGKGCSMCKPAGWITICGAGMVHPNVLRNCGYDPEVWQGFAFGFGAERLAMLKYNITDIRTFYINDLRETKIFDRRSDN